jgi:hypothetical protein
VFLFVLAGLRAFMTEDEMELGKGKRHSKKSAVPHTHERETNLCAWAGKVRTEHDDPGSLVRELLSTSLEAILEQFEVSTTAVATLLVFDLILNDERLVGNVDGLVEGGRYGVVRRDTLCDETKIALNDSSGSFFD